MEIKPAPFDTKIYRGGAYIDLVEKDSITFILTAPGKKAVSLIGDFNEWNEGKDFFSHDGKDIWWITTPINYLKKGERNGVVNYQFNVVLDDEGYEVKICDPYAREVNWTRYGPVAVLSFDPPYQWKCESFNPVPLKDAIIYEINVRDFVAKREGNIQEMGVFKGVIEKLDYLLELGITAIELMPVTNNPLKSSWGYNPVYYFAPEDAYGRPNELKELIDTAHQKGIAVIIDIVLNHAGGAASPPKGEHPYYYLYPDLKKNPFFHLTWKEDLQWVAKDFNHWSEYTKNFTKDIITFWINEYKVDGFRFDWVGGIDFDPENPQRDYFDPYGGISPIVWNARQCKSNVYLIGEYFVIAGSNPNKSASKLVHNTEMDAVWHDSFHDIMETILLQGWEWEKKPIWNIISGSKNEGFTSSDQLINYITSHDEKRPMYEIKYYNMGKISVHPELKKKYPDEESIALQKTKLGCAILFTSIGVPMLWQGEEFAEDTERTCDFRPLDWKKLKYDKYKNHLEYFKRLIKCRKENEALRLDNNIEISTELYFTKKVLRYKRWNYAGNIVIVVANFDNYPHIVDVPFPETGNWYDYSYDTTETINTLSKKIEVAEWSARVFVHR